MPAKTASTFNLRARSTMVGTVLALAAAALAEDVMDSQAYLERALRAGSPFRSRTRAGWRRGSSR